MIKKRFKKPKRTKRIQLTLYLEAINLLELASKHNGNSMSKINSELIIQKLRDPIQRIDDELKEHAKKINILQEEKKRLMELKRDHPTLR